MHLLRLLANFLFVCSAGILFSLTNAAAEDGAELPRSAKHRPKIGLVLEGGGALGFAHVGVLKVLKENHVPIDVVAGTSIGSIVGAGFASGLTVEQMENAMNETKWGDLFGEKVMRGNLTYRLKSGRGRELYGDTKFGFKEGKFASPAGLIIGQNILPLFQKLFNTMPTPCDFDSLPLPFRAVTADLETGEAYVPKSGNLATVVRASMSVPGVFSPVELDGRVLIDGGIVDNLPVDVARDLGAEVLVVSVLNDELSKRDNLNSLLDVSGQMVSLLLQQNSTISLKTVRPEDVLIPVPLKGYTAGDFDKAKEIMAIGERAARDYIESMRRYSISDTEYEIYDQRRTKKEDAPIKLDFIRVKNTSEISDSKIMSQFRLKPGGEFDRAVAEEDVQKIFGTGYFNSVHYEVVTENGRTGLEIEAAGKPWLQQFVRLGFALEDNFEGDSAFRLGAAYRRYNMTSQGSYGELAFETGKYPRLALEYYQPLGDESPYFFAPQVSYSQSNLSIRESGQTIAQYDRADYISSFMLGRELGSYGEMGAGMTRGYGSLDRDIGDPTLADFDYDIGEAFARIDIDTVDTPDFPTKGYTTRLSYTSSLQDLGASDTFDTVAGSATLPLSWDRDTIVLAGEFGSTLADRPVERSFSLGGFLDISGYQQGFISASDYTQGRLIYFHRFSEVQNPVFNLGFFFGGSLELTSALVDAPQLADHAAIFSGSVFLGADTPILPTYIGYGVNDENENSFYLAIGRIGQRRK